eukprot:CAMPEP_0113905984 /NCGR_PEP_ID=MMETSP0780_2-20120614/24423_1 /TAXON_ID=652834 /ORGANISM="Palpitomonas bilix" /LENGTH=604 /DNA_ID=CAMNT_0000900389 /DNA_START=89 /DNA_END=1903 /DNA_ORIENTATION=- /assembly_acc=CAM_ASM_000599
MAIASKLAGVGKKVGRGVLAFLPLLSLLCLCAGIAAIIYLPSLPEIGMKYNYFSEHAFSPGNVASDFDEGDAEGAMRIMSQLGEEMGRGDGRVAHPADAVVKVAKGLGLDQAGTVSYTSPKGEGKYAVVVVESPRGDGRESLLVQVHLPDHSAGRGVEDVHFPAPSLALALASNMEGRQGLSKDVFFVFVQSDADTVEYGAQAFLDDFYGVSNRSVPFRRGSILRVCTHLTLLAPFLGEMSGVSIDMFGADGRRANLDLNNVMVFVASRASIPPSVYHRDIPPAYVKKVNAVVPSYLNTHLHFITSMAASLPSSSLWRYLDSNVDGMHLRFAYAKGASTQRSREERMKVARKNFASTGRMVDLYIRAQNNLLERVHQSFWYYMIPFVGTYVSIADYTAAAAPLFLPIVFAILLPPLLADKKEGKRKGGHSTLASNLLVFTIVAGMNAPFILTDINVEVAGAMSIASLFLPFLFLPALTWEGGQPIALLFLLSSAAVMLLRNYPVGVGIAALSCIVAPMLVARKSVVGRGLQCLLLLSLSPILLVVIIPGWINGVGSLVASPFHVYEWLRSASSTFSLWGPPQLFVIVQTSISMAAALSLKKDER